MARLSFSNQVKNQEKFFFAEQYYIFEIHEDFWYLKKPWRIKLK